MGRIEIIRAPRRRNRPARGRVGAVSPAVLPYFIILFTRVTPSQRPFISPGNTPKSLQISFCVTPHLASPGHPWGCRLTTGSRPQTTKTHTTTIRHVSKLPRLCPALSEGRPFLRPSPSSPDRAVTTAAILTTTLARFRGFFGRQFGQKYDVKKVRNRKCHRWCARYSLGETPCFSRNTTLR